MILSFSGMLHKKVNSEHLNRPQTLLKQVKLSRDTYSSPRHCFRSSSNESKHLFPFSLKMLESGSKYRYREVKIKTNSDSSEQGDHLRNTCVWFLRSVEECERETWYFYFLFLVTWWISRWYFIYKHTFYYLFFTLWQHTGSTAWYVY